LHAEEPIWKRALAGFLLAGLATLAAFVCKPTLVRSYSFAYDWQALIGAIATLVAGWLAYRAAREPFHAAEREREIVTAAATLQVLAFAVELANRVQVLAKRVETGGFNALTVIDWTASGSYDAPSISMCEGRTRIMLTAAAAAIAMYNLAVRIELNLEVVDSVWAKYKDRHAAAIPLEEFKSRRQLFMPPDTEIRENVEREIIAEQALFFLKHALEKVDNVIRTASAHIDVVNEAEREREATSQA
jgi:hypothetical protein